MIDGVVDSENYYASQFFSLAGRKSALNLTQLFTPDLIPALWDNNLLDTWKGYQLLFDACSASKPSECALHEDTPELVRARIDAILDNLKTRPLYLRHSNDSSNFDTVDYASVKSVIFQSLYRPYLKFENLTLALAALERGDGVPILKMQDETTHLACKCSSSGKEGFADTENAEEAQMAIACGDGDIVKDTLEDVKRYHERTSEISEFADM